MRAQQRTSALRRIGQNPFGVQFANVAWRVKSMTFNTITLTMLCPGTWADDTTTDFLLRGIPNFAVTGSPAVISGATWTKPDLILQFDNGLADGFNMLMATNDPAFRSPFGGYLNGGLFVQPPAVVPIVDSIASAPVVAGNVVTFTIDNGGGTIYGQDALPLLLNGVTGPVSQPTFANQVLTADFGIPVLPGDTLDYVGGAQFALNVSGGTLADFALVAP